MCICAHARSMSLFMLLMLPTKQYISQYTYIRCMRTHSLQMPEHAWHHPRMQTGMRTK